jgi:hypothetical protein
MSEPLAVPTAQHGEVNRAHDLLKFSPDVPMIALGLSKPRCGKCSTARHLRHGCRAVLFGLLPLLLFPAALHTRTTFLAPTTSPALSFPC